MGSIPSLPNIHRLQPPLVGVRVSYLRPDQVTSPQHSRTSQHATAGNSCPNPAIHILIAVAGEQYFWFHLKRLRAFTKDVYAYSESRRKHLVALAEVAALG